MIVFSFFARPLDPSTETLEKAAEPPRIPSPALPPPAANPVVAERAMESARPLLGVLDATRKSALTGPPAPPNSFTLDGATARVLTPSGPREIPSQEGQFDRLPIRQEETVAVHVRLPVLIPGHEVVIAASDGGRIERRNGSLSFTAREPSANLDLAFTPTLGRGNYRIDIRHAGSVATLAFWAGPEFPAGEPGPAFVPLPDPPTTVP
ncbi:MAG: hypothetical protein SFU53_13235 [Terrimicrobiaceae bacterium]|nr:hypothetical protein [Terrimicrobiaceae bacterium]